VKQLNVLLAIFVSGVLAIAVFEFGLRLVPAFRAQPTLNQFDPLTGWSKTPSKTVTRNVAGQKIEFAINENGLRDDAGVGPTKPAGKMRVMALGDSFVLGYTVPREHCFVDLLEKRWNAEGRNVDVVNTGTEGWSTDQEAAWFSERGAAYQPDLVLIFPYENDIYWCGENHYSRFPKPRYLPDGTLEKRVISDPGPTPVIQSSSILRLLALGVSAVKRMPQPGDFVAPGTTITLAGEWSPLLKQPPEFVKDCESRADGALIALQAACNKIGARLVVIPIPSKSAIHADEREFFRTWSEGLAGLPDDAWSPDRPVDRFLELARAHKIATVDPRADLRSVADRTQAKLYFAKKVEWHLNAAGNAAFANVVHDELDKLAVFPDAHAAVTAVAAAELDPDPPAPTGPRRWPWIFGALWIALSALYLGTYANDRNWLAPLKVGAMLAAVFTIVLGGGALVKMLPPSIASWVAGGFVLLVLGFVTYKLGRRIATILELLRSFVMRGHWYLMPLLVVLLSIGSLLVVAASSPLIAPFIYTLF
jgi:hypothetical protein